MPNYKKTIAKFNPANIDKERRIENINQETGVTAEQLIDHVTFLSTSMKEARDLTPAQRHDAIYTIVTAVYHKMQEGKVPNKNFDDFKSYLFRSAHNLFLQERHRFQRPTESIYTNSVDIDEYYKHAEHPSEAPYDDNFLPDNYNIARLRKAIKKLPANHQKTLQIFFESNGESLVDLGIARQMVLARESLRTILRVKPKQKTHRLPKRDWTHYDIPYLIKLIGLRAGHNIKRYIELKETIQQKIDYCKEKGLTETDTLKVLRIDTVKQYAIKLKEEGLNQNQIAKKLGCAKSTISYHLNENVQKAARVANRKFKAKAKLMKENKV